MYSSHLTIISCIQNKTRLRWQLLRNTIFLLTYYYINPTCSSSHTLTVSRSLSPSSTNGCCSWETRAPSTASSSSPCFFFCIPYSPFSMCTPAERRSKPSSDSRKKLYDGVIGTRIVLKFKAQAVWWFAKFEAEILYFQGMTKRNDYKIPDYKIIEL